MNDQSRRAAGGMRFRHHDARAIKEIIAVTIVCHHNAAIDTTHDDVMQGTGASKRTGRIVKNA